MEQVVSDENLKTEDDKKYAGLWIRFCAYLIDYLVIFILGYLIGVCLGILFSASGLDGVLAPLSGFLGLLVKWAYYVYMTYNYESTLGKRFFGLRVIPAKGGKVDLGQVFLREVIGKTVSVITFGVGFLMIAFDKKKEGLHDKIGKTQVVYLKNSEESKWKMITGIVLCVAIFIIASMFIFGVVMTALIEESSESKSESLYAQTVLLGTIGIGKECLENGKSILQPETSKGKGQICSDDQATAWPELMGNLDYGMITDENIEIVLGSGEILVCSFNDGKCNFSINK